MSFFKAVRPPTYGKVLSQGAKIYPTGEGVLFPIPRRKRDRNDQLDPIKEEWRADKRWHRMAFLIHPAAFAAKILLDCASHETKHETDPWEGTPSALVLASGTISHKPRSRKGARGISSHERRLLRWSAARVEKLAGKPQYCSFLTLTIPNLSPEQWQKLCVGWAEVVRTFNQWLKRRLTARGLPGHVVGCVELQPERTQRDGVPALHTHITFQGRARNKSWAVTPLQCRKAWARSLAAVVGRLDKVGSLEKLVQVQKSTSQYLAKYLSKGGSCWDEWLPEEYKELHPTSWAFCPLPLRKLYNSLILVGDAALAIAYHVIKNRYARHGTIVNLPIYQLPNGQWAKVVLFKLERKYAKFLNPEWVS